MTDVGRRGGRVNRKHGRQKRKPTHIRYTESKRWIINKARKIASYMKRHPKWKPNNLSDDVKIQLKILMAKQ